MSFKNVIRSAVVVLFIILTLVNVAAKKKKKAVESTPLNLSGSGETSTLPMIETMADMEALFAHEPGYREIQQVAMRYAEVHPDKIAAWRSGASLRAFLPRVDYDYDWRTYVQTDSAERLLTDYATQDQRISTSQTQVDDSFTRQYEESDRSDRDDTSWQLTERYSQDYSSREDRDRRVREDTGTRTDLANRDRDQRDTRWRVRLIWDLRDFLYDNDQPRISTEARRLVELRQDVLQEINTYFFDRRRAQIEMMFSPPDDVRSKIDLQLQIARVTASIDALTGGYLSAELEKSKSK